MQSFSCGAACDAVKGIKVLQGGGDEGATPRCKFPIPFLYFVFVSGLDRSLTCIVGDLGWEVLIATDPSSKAVVVAHQGTDPQNVLSLLNDAEFLPVGLDLKRFPKAASASPSLLQ